MKFHKIIPLSIYFFVNLTLFSFSQDRFTTTEAPALKSTPVITAGYIFQLLMSLLIVFGLMYIIAKYVLPKLKTTTKGKYIEVIDRIGLEPQVSAYIIKAKDKQYLTIISNKGVSTITRLDSK